MKKPSVMIVLALALTLFSACAHMTGTGVGEPAAPVLDRILNKGELVVGTAGTMPPLNMTTKEGEIIGLEPDIARYMAKAMDVKIRFETMPFSELLPALEAGKVDMVLSSMTMTPKRNLKAAFIGPYFVSGRSFLTKLQTVGSAARSLWRSSSLRPSS
jgi:polar amino acid transport system substrate-binding protein